MTTLDRRLERLEAHGAHRGVTPSVLIAEGGDIEQAWRAQFPGQPFPGVGCVFAIVLRGVKPLERRDDDRA